MSLTEIRDLGNEKLREYGLYQMGWRCVWDTRASARLGQCRYTRQEIGLSRKVFSLPENQHLAANTILHEIAHALVGPGHHHDAAWQRMARSIGCNAHRCTELAVKPKAKYSGKCNCGDSFHQKHRLSMDRSGTIANYKCCKCRVVIVWRVNR